ncbi:CDP-glycerol glycerophosphotransferase family protein [Agarivorans sp. TSD2052]|uniref:CDP-glycerol glycerophosphotransferase family protein n=1 Tax=Agarivorans sp. TSD2052 TaxID=2937286 RepID=UPI00200C7289|nr:CDP-glycerol glycerophosphotransferase family protein [Agarivorans sp. TSD2052]UPW20174.1 CDP-glycerol glycerophosphotransferase family protein [Agarivorans sp. TSD2052]
METIPTYIVGAGSFAAKLASILQQYKIEYIFVDEYAKSPINSRPVVKAEALTSSNGLFLVAISIPQYAKAAEERLLEQGVAQKQILQLNYDSAVVTLASMLTINKDKALTELYSPHLSFADFEQRFFVKNRVKSSSDSKQFSIGFNFLGRGGGFRKHAGQLRETLAVNHNIATFSDEMCFSGDQPESYNIYSQERMLNSNWADLTVTTNFYPCSPPSTTKLTLMHMIYDFLLFSEETSQGMRQAENHYIYMPSKPCMELHKRICFEKKLNNNIVLIPGGYIRQDDNQQRYNEIALKHPEPECIVYAPTLSSLLTAQQTKYSYSILHAEEFLRDILRTFPDRKIIFRPHPEDLDLVESGIKTQRAKAFRRILSFCKEHPMCSIDDKRTDYIETFAKSIMMITDTSAIAYSFALTTGRPVIFFSPNQTKLQEALPNVLYIRDREHFGVCVETTQQLISAVKKILDGKVSCNTDFVNQVVFNRGCAEKYLVDNLDYILTNKKHPDWWYLQENL